VQPAYHDSLHAVRCLTWIANTAVLCKSLPSPSRSSGAALLRSIPLQNTAGTAAFPPAFPTAYHAEHRLSNHHSLFWVDRDPSLTANRAWRQRLPTPSQTSEVFDTGGLHAPSRPGTLASTGLWVLFCTPHRASIPPESGSRCHVHWALRDVPPELLSLPCMVGDCREARMAPDECVVHGSRTANVCATMAYPRINFDVTSAVINARCMNGQRRYVSDVLNIYRIA
jgi:hypothetical protein